MAETLRMAVAVLGNCASVLPYAAPIVTFKRVIRKKSTEEFSCLPYIIAMLNCLLFTWYGMPIISYKWENFPVVIVNGVGIILESSYVLIYFWYASPKRKVSVAVTAILVMLVFCVTAGVSAFAFHDHRRRKLLVGSIGLVVAVTMYGSPLIVMKKVIKTKSVECMPSLPLCLCQFLASVLGLPHELLTRDIFIMGSNFVKIPVAILQLILHRKYRKKTVAEEPNKEDVENGDKEKVDLENGNIQKEDVEKENVELEMGELEKNNEKESNGNR